MIRFSLNGEPVEVQAMPMTRLIDVLREHLRFTGTKEAVVKASVGHAPSWWTAFL